jgi:hypothetical protein
MSPFPEIAQKQFDEYQKKHGLTLTQETAIRYRSVTVTAL